MWPTLPFSSILKQETPTKPIPPEKRVQDFLEHPYHLWIRNRSQLFQLLKNFFLELPPPILTYLLVKKELKMLAIFDQLSCLLTLSKPSNYILIFPPLYKRLTSAAPQFGLAILAHELGHLIMAHHSRVVTEEKAQLEADQIVVALGLGKELLEVLEEYAHFPFISERINSLKKELGLKNQS